MSCNMRANHVFTSYTGEPGRSGAEAISIMHAGCQRGHNAAECPEKEREGRPDRAGMARTRRGPPAASSNKKEFKLIT